jgi:tripartite-type tricarboxylate transporter receptor subunit TctC
MGLSSSSSLAPTGLQFTIKTQSCFEEKYLNLQRTILCLCVLAHIVGGAVAQSFPSKPIRLVIGSVPGGGNDLVGRILALKLTENLGQQVVVDNRGGANGIIGMELVARAAPDGYTFYMGTAGHLSVNPALYPEMPFNIGRDFTPLTQVVSLPFLIYQHPSVPAKTLGDLIAYAKANPGKVTWSSSGNGGLPHLTGALLNLVTGINTRRIPYKGSAPAFNDLLGGRVQYCIEAVSIGLQHVKTGRLLALATTGPSRLPFLPEVAALNETLPGLVVLNWYGMVLPAGVSREVVNRLHAEIHKAMAIPEIRLKLTSLGFDPIGSTPAEFATARKTEEVRWARVIKEANIRAE